MAAAFPLADTMSSVMESAGVVIIGASALLSAVFAAGKAGRSSDWSAAYNVFRATFGRGILLGLEFLVAADIIRTVAITPTLESVTVLAFVIAIRTFLSVSIRAEIEGGWPWRKRGDADPQPGLRRT